MYLLCVHDFVCDCIIKRSLARCLVCLRALESPSVLNLFYFTWNDNTQSFGSYKVKPQPSKWRQPSTPYTVVRQFQSLYTPSPRGPSPRHIVRQFQSPFTPSPRHRLSKDRCVTSVKKLSHGRHLPGKCRSRNYSSFGLNPSLLSKMLSAFLLQL